jgi:hypothetical protein
LNQLPEPELNLHKISKALRSWNGMSLHEFREIVSETIKLRIPLHGEVHNSTAERLLFIESSKTGSIGQFSKLVKSMKNEILKKYERQTIQRALVVKQYLSLQNPTFGDQTTIALWPKLINGIMEWLPEETSFFVKSVQRSMILSGEIATAERVARKIDSIEQKFRDGMIPREQISKIIEDARIYRRVAAIPSQQSDKFRASQQARGSALSQFLMGEEVSLALHWPQTMDFIQSRKNLSFEAFIAKFKDIFTSVSPGWLGAQHASHPEIFSFLEEFEYFMKDPERLQLYVKMEKLAKKYIETKEMQTDLVEYSKYVRSTRKESLSRNVALGPVRNYSFVDKLNERYYSVFGAER